MKRPLRVLLISLLLVAGPAALGLAGQQANAAPPSDGRVPAHAICRPPTTGSASCGVQIAARDTSGSTGTITSPTPIGLTPSQIHTAYNLPTTSPRDDLTIAIVVGFDNPNAKADLDVYNRTFGLPTFPTCTSTITKACFEKVMQKPRMTVDPVWALESSLDVQTAHQVCQNCKILLVEGTTNSWTNLMWAVDTAVARGADVVNLSFAGVEASTLVAQYDAKFNRPGIAFVSASGDWGYDVRYPASSRFVTAVGGTTLNLADDGGYLGETAWTKAGSGCSLYSAKPAFQQDTGCAKRAVADVAAVADPATGAAIYSSIGYNGQRGWFQLGGTSLSAPIISGVYALAGVTANAQQNALPYDAAAQPYLRDVTSGTTAGCGTYLCNAGVGYDGPTGLGSPFGVGAFQ